MTYTITLPIPLFTSDGRRFAMAEALARDILTHIEHERSVRLLVPRGAADAAANVVIDLADHPNLTIAQLPYDGMRKSFPAALPALWRVLRAEARRAETWHSCCSLELFDLTHLSWHAGRTGPRFRVLGLDSDTAAMIQQSGGPRLKADYVRRRYRRWAARADMTVLVGEGVEQVYGSYAKRPVQTPAVWLQEGDLADPDTTRAKFADVHETVRVALPSRFTAWKGIDDAIFAFRQVANRLPAWQLDIIGDGEMRSQLEALAAGEPRIRFLPSLAYGPAFFAALRNYHLVVAPTRALEQTRIVFDAAASGCVVFHSDTPALTDAMRDVRTWRFPPGEVHSFATALEKCADARDSWSAAALGGIEAMRGRTIATMHRIRQNAMEQLRVTT